MKTSIKILLLMISVFLVTAAVLVFEKTRVSPPGGVKIENQFDRNLEQCVDAYKNDGNFKAMRQSYIDNDDKIRLYYSENFIDAKAADDYRKKIDEKYGDSLIEFGYDTFNKPVWPDETLSTLVANLDQLSGDQLTDGTSAVSQDFKKEANKIKEILGDYQKAWALARSGGFSSVDDAARRISDANMYASMNYLQNNSALVSALRELPARLAAAHYNHVSAAISSLGNFRNMSYDHYMDVLIPKVQDVLDGYKNTNIYGSHKQSTAALESRAGDLIDAAVAYYDY